MQEHEGGDGASRSGANASVRGPEHVRDRVEALIRGRQRFRVGGLIGTGGFSQVRLVEDGLLQRTSARKVLIRPETLDRFLDEARVTARLNHPGVVAVHDLGVDAAGQAFIDMALVSGRSLMEVFELARAGAEGWTIARALDAVFKVCQTVAHAHDRGIIHRDLKPDNVMVGDYGDVYVVDWGLARVLDGADVPESGAPPDPALAANRTNGQALGTPFYMPPEQAAGGLVRVDRRADVYALGAMLYHLCGGRPPYQPVDRPTTAQEVLHALAQGPPVPLAETAPRTAPALLAIVERAMRREPGERYADVGGLAADLRAFLELRVVRAYRTGPWAELVSWIRRNRFAAVAACSAVAALLLGLAVAAVLGQSARRERDNVLRLAAMRDLEGLVAEARDLWPSDPGAPRRMSDWLTRADALVAGLHPDPVTGDVGHIERWMRLRRRSSTLQESEVGASVTPSKAQPAANPAAVRAQVAAHLGEHLVFPSDTDAWWYARIEELLAALFSFSDPEVGLVRGRSLNSTTGPSVERRLALARELSALEASADHASAWQAALASIASNTRYSGARLRPQADLLPMGEDPVSGLFEFWHVQSGARPASGAPSEDAGITFVLIPGGTTWVGSQKDDEGAPNFDPLCFPALEAPPQPFTVAPFLLAKHEVTQAQWSRWMGANPSHFEAGRPYLDTLLDGRHPVEQVGAAEARAFCERIGGRLPSELEWEHAARAGSGLPHGNSGAHGRLGDYANVADVSMQTRDPQPGYTYAEFDDGWVGTAPVGSLLPNAFGLFDTLGNVFEWCEPALDLPGRAPLEPGAQVLRGGSWCVPPEYARIANRWPVPAGFVRWETGVRPARSLDETL